jgi:hypothetical protein
MWLSTNFMHLYVWNGMWKHVLNLVSTIFVNLSYMFNSLIINQGSLMTCPLNESYNY